MMDLKAIEHELRGLRAKQKQDHVTNPEAIEARILVLEEAKRKLLEVNT